MLVDRRGYIYYITCPIEVGFTLHALRARRNRDVPKRMPGFRTDANGKPFDMIETKKFQSDVK